jgi:hypothetical protein
MNEPRKLWFVMTPAGASGPYVNCAAAHDAADPRGFSVFFRFEGYDEVEEDEDDGCLSYEDREGGYDSDYADE